MFNRQKLLFFLTLVLSIFFTQQVTAQQEKMRVGTVGSSPFMFDEKFDEDEDIRGISVDIWKSIAQSQNIDYELVPIQNMNDALKAVVEKEVDLLIGPISITPERLKRVEFTQPYYISEIGLLVTTRNATIWHKVKPFFGLAFISSVGILIILLFIMGNLLWLAERRKNSEQFPKEYLPGIFNSMWFALVTLTTVGYGDKAPVTKTGKLLTGVWMIITMVTASSLTAGIATALTLSLSQQKVATFQNYGDLVNKRIGVVEGTTGEILARSYDAKIVPASSLQEAINSLISGKVQGVVFDTPALKYYLKQNPEQELKLAPFSLSEENYGFALALDNDMIQQLDIIITRMQLEGEIEEIIKKWLN